MSIGKYSSILTLEADQYSLVSFPKITSGSAYSSWFDAVGMTVAGVVYPFGMTAAQLTLQSKYEQVPSLGTIQFDYQTNTGSYRTWNVVAASKTTSTYIAFTWEPSLSLGARFIRVVSLDSTGTPVTEAADRQLFVLARKIP